MNNSKEYQQALDFALAMLKHNDEVTDELIREKVNLALKMIQLQGSNENFDPDTLIWDLQSRFTVRMAQATILDGEERVDWLPKRRDSIEWRFWKRYERYLLEEKKLSPLVVRRIDELTDSIIERIEDPTKNGHWDRRGMVAGQVQSGKTGNYTGLICKAADAGYRLIIVLAGIHNNLRSQTQIRLDQGVLGYNTRQNMTFDPNNRRTGVGKLRGEQLHPVHSLTNAEERGDFQITIAKHSNIDLRAVPTLLVVKKNGSILKNLINWATKRHGEKDPATGRLIVHDIPLLLIDDECDNASINTREDDTNPTTINARIRELLNSFSQSAYVGYTATPFANIFIDVNSNTHKHGDDLFPRDFIINLPAPDNYVGSSRVFGITADPDSGLEEQDGLPIVHTVKDYQDWMPDTHKTDHVPSELPYSLKKAVKSFIISCAARMARGQDKEHNSMLVHVTRWNEVQILVKNQVHNEIKNIQHRLRYGEGGYQKKISEEFRRLWEEDFVPTTKAIDDPEKKLLTWQEVEKFLEPAAQKIQVKTINGKAKEVLDYEDNPDGISVIAIGGDKLSRGLTLEGLTVSYFLRASKMYDTLMQMGRWFGYRPGYLDLCRLYTSEELIYWYQHITLANEELRQEFDYMAMLNKTPSNFGLRVRTHSDGLTISNVGKIRKGKVLRVTYAGAITETVAFDKNPAINNKNIDSFVKFLNLIGKPEKEPRINNIDAYVWTNLDGNDIVALLKEVKTHRDSIRANSQLLADYVSQQIMKNELRNWTVVLKSKKDAKKPLVGKYEVGLYKRTGSKASNSERYSIQRLVSPDDEVIYLPGGSRQIKDKKTFRENRDPDRGLLLIYPLDPAEAGLEGNPILGFALSFPGSQNASSVEYLVNNVYYAQEFGEENQE
ncbi:Z1 domain-containing protein [Brasilonema bromeliae]|uniref:Endonuclease n=1 Tax=Brasilonema bromeliae SPC951 TaxID=385972 RepID=A0ABX1P988_9CYAN|nr:Z1 domain-containing protein [Brasilonema bromeliae]NMG20916.1 endonuclease [Brasilonema bromeliae SPC951]